MEALAEQGFHSASDDRMKVGRGGIGGGGGYCLPWGVVQGLPHIYKLLAFSDRKNKFALVSACLEIVNFCSEGYQVSDCMVQHSIS
jgi:hypothetical protein